MKLFIISIHTDDVVLEDMNLFLRSHRVTRCLKADGKGTKRIPKDEIFNLSDFDI